MAAGVMGVHGLTLLCLETGIAMGPFQVGGKLPFDKLRANGQAFPFALSLSKGKFAPKLK
jgi:hypothetical protein